MHAGLADSHISLGLLLRRHGVGVFLLADRIGFDQRLVALGQCASLRQIGFSTRLTSFCAGGGGGVWRGVNTEEWLTGFYIAAFTEQALLQNTGGTRPDLRDARSLKAAGKFGYQTNVALLHRHHTDLSRRRRGAARRLATFATSSQKQ